MSWIYKTEEKYPHLAKTHLQYSSSSLILELNKRTAIFSYLLYRCQVSKKTAIITVTIES